MFTFVTFELHALQEPPYDLAPSTSFLLRSFGRLVKLLSSSDVVFSIGTPSTTQVINPEAVFIARQLLIHWLGKRGGTLPTALFHVS